jgi:hypothetical protein
MTKTNATHKSVSLSAVIKYFSLLMWTLVAIDVYSQQQIKVDESFEFRAKPDSIIARRQHGYIYITRDTSAKMFDWLVPEIRAHSGEMDIFRGYASYIKKKFARGVIVKNLGGFPRKWNSVHVLKNKYFVYSPSDWISNKGYYVSDSAIFVVKSDPDDLLLILDYKNGAKNQHTFRLVNYAGDKLELQIRLVDAASGIYLWAFKNHGGTSMQLMQDSRFVNRLPMIVADCGDEKFVLEFDFDEPDFEKILGKK